MFVGLWDSGRELEDFADPHEDLERVVFTFFANRVQARQDSRLKRTGFGKVMSTEELTIKWLAGHPERNVYATIADFQRSFELASSFSGPMKDIYFAANLRDEGVTYTEPPEHRSVAHGRLAAAERILESTPARVNASLKLSRQDLMDGIEWANVTDEMRIFAASKGFDFVDGRPVPNCADAMVETPEKDEAKSPADFVGDTAGKLLLEFLSMTYQQAWKLCRPRLRFKICK
jgi:hypothetical protein